MNQPVVLADNNDKLSLFLSNSNTQVYLDNVLGAGKDRFVTNLVSLSSQNPALQECTNISLMSGAIVATTLNLSLNKSFGYAYLVPFKNKNNKDKNGNPKVEAQFQIGYKGYIQLAMRTGEYKRLNAVPIYENQFISWNPMEEELKLNNIDGEGKIVGYVAYFRLINGFEKTIYWTIEKMQAHANTFSQAFNLDSYLKLQAGKIPQSDIWKYSSFWYKNFDEMALKTMLRQLLSKYGILSESMQKAYEYDQSVIINDKPNYIEAPRASEQEVVIQEDNFADEETKTQVNIDDL